MKAFCIPKDLSDTLRKAAQQGKINIKEMYEMTSEQRRDLFTKYTTEGVASEINGGFEKAMISSQKEALNDWVKTVFTKQERKSSPKHKDVIDKINELDELGVLNPKNADSFLTDLVASRLGATVTEEEVRNISEKAKNLEELSKVTSEFGLPTYGYFEARNEMNNYIDSLTPANRMLIATSTIGRGTMLMSVKSPLTNIISNTTHGLVQAFERRLSSGKAGGVNNKFALDYVKEVNKIYKKTGYDVSRMLSLDMAQLTLGETRIHSQGKGLVRAVGRFYEDFVFKKLMGAPDVAFSSVAFADSANIATTKIAKSEGLEGKELEARALEIFKDATKLEPVTDEGYMVRQQAIADATYSTYTNDSTASWIGLSIRQILNKATGDLRLGDQVLPFVKTPANVVEAGLDMAGLGLIKNVFEIPKAIKAFREGDRGAFRGVTRNFVRSGLGLTLAYILVAGLDPDDFSGSYPTTQKERELWELEGRTPNSIRIAGKWISLDYFGPLGAPVTGMLYARKYGTDLQSSVFAYSKGVSKQITSIPGLTYLTNTIKGISDIKIEKNNTLQENVGGVTNFIADFISARTIPSIVYDIAKATDEYERKTDSKDWVSKLKAKIPGLRQTLPVDINILGEERKAEPAWSIILFGSRLKTVGQSKVIKEIERLENLNLLPSITDVEKTSTRVKELKTKISPEKYDEAIITYKKSFGNAFKELINTTEYKELSDEDKKDVIESLKSKQLDLILKEYDPDGNRKKKTTPEQKRAQITQKKALNKVLRLSTHKN